MPYPDRKAVLHRVVAIRVALGLEKMEFADRIAFDRTSWSKVENGTRDLPLQAAWRIYQLTGCSLDFIFDGKLHGLPPSLAPKVFAAMQPGA